MAMSKRHYEMVARVIRVNRAYAKVDRNAEDAVNDVAIDLAAAFASDNERFDRARFLAACEVPR